MIGRLFLVAILLLSCTWDTTIEPCKKMPLIFSDSLPIQFWVNGKETFNEKQVCGLIKQECYCQPINCDDEIRVQFQYDTNNDFELAIYDSSGQELQRMDFVEISSGIYEASFVFNEQSSPGICDQSVQIKVEQLALGSLTIRTSSGSRQWTSVAYGNGVFVAVTSTGAGNMVMRSTDGITWANQTTPVSNAWTSVCFGDGIFVAVSNTGTGDRVMTSTDGITWTSRVSASDKGWSSVAYGNGLFVAVAFSSADINRVMTSPDGVTWTLRAAAASLGWSAVTYGNGLFVAVSSTGTGNRVMTSPTGVTWTSRTSAADNSWAGVTYGDGLFVAIATDGYPSNVMTSANGITWSTSTVPYNTEWVCVTYGNGLFVAFPRLSVGKVLYSSNGTTWTLTQSPSVPVGGVAYGESIFVAVGGTNGGGFNQVITSTVSHDMVAQSDCLDIKQDHECTLLIEYENTSDFDNLSYEAGSPGPSFQLRIPAVFHEEKNPQEQEDIELSNGRIITLRQTIQEKRLLEIGFVPNYMHRKIQKVLMHDTVFIDGDYWKRRDAYEDSPVKKYNLKRATVLLTKYDSVEKNTI